MPKNKSNIVSALIVDDNENFRSGFIEYLNYLTDLSIAGEAKDGDEALKQIEKFKPDIVFMDVFMPGIDGFTAVNRIKEGFPDVKIVIVTIYEKHLFREISASLNVDGFICKSSISEELPKILKKLDVFASTSVE